MKILPNGKFMTINPNTTAISRMQTFIKIMSPTDCATKPNVAKEMVTRPDANPLNPSTILMALAIPATAKAVKITEITGQPSNQSTPNISKRFRLMPLRNQAKMPLAKVAARRINTPTFFVRSSVNPNIKAGILAKTNGNMRLVSASSNKYSELVMPKYIATPPTLGVGLV